MVVRYKKKSARGIWTYRRFGIDYGVAKLFKSYMIASGNIIKSFKSIRHCYYA